VDCVHQRRPVIHNDYAALPHRKGLPDGHAPVIRELVVPVFRGELIVAILGVGNKATDYDDDDVATVSQFADLAWDLAERTRAEEALRASEERYRMLVETASEGVWVMDGDHITTYVNEAMAAMLGYQPEDMVGQPVESFFFQEDMAFHAERMRARHAGLDETYERRFRHRNGSVVWTIATAKAVKATAGGFAGSFAMFTDISARKRAEEALERSRAELQAIYDHAPVMMCVLDGDRSVVYANRAFEAFVGRPAADLSRLRACGVLGCINASDDPRGCVRVPLLRVCGPRCP